MTSPLPEEMRERVEREFESIISQIIGQHTSLTDPRNKGIISEFAERYATRFAPLLEETDRRAREDCKSMVSKALYTEGVSVELASRVLANYENRFALQSPSRSLDNAET